MAPKAQGAMIRTSKFLAEKIFHFIHEAFVLRRMFFTVLGKRFIELTQEIFLLLSQINRRFHKHMDIKIAHVT